MNLWIEFPWKIPFLALIVILYTYCRFGSLRSIGFSCSPNFMSTFLWAAIVSFVIIVLVGYLMVPLLEAVFGETDYSAYGELVGNEKAAFQLWWTAMISAAVGEEIVFRGFLLGTLERVIGKEIWHKFFIVIFGALLFGLVHYQQGISGIISIIVVGLIFGAAFFASKKNLWSLILAHAIVDTWGIYSIYKGWY